MHFFELMGVSLNVRVSCNTAAFSKCLNGFDPPAFFSFKKNQIKNNRILNYFRNTYTLRLFWHLFLKAFFRFVFSEYKKNSNFLITNIKFEFYFNDVALKDLLWKWLGNNGKLYTCVYLFYYLQIFLRFNRKHINYDNTSN